MMSSRGLALMFVMSAAVGSGFAQANIARDIYFQTSVGSFKALGNPGDPAKGTLKISFRGTFLISRLTPESKVKVEGDVRKEKEDQPHGKQVYHGQGTITIEGGFDAVQFFGKDLTGEFHGKAYFRMYGEFDQNLNTGFYWFTPGGRKNDWGTGGINVPIPFDLKYSAPQISVKPAVKVESKPPTKGKG